MKMRLWHYTPSQIQKNARPPAKPKNSIVIPAARISSSFPPTRTSLHIIKLKPLLQPLQKAPHLLIHLPGRLLQAANWLLGTAAAGSAHLAGRALPVLVPVVIVFGGSVDLVVDVVAGWVGGVVGMLVMLVLVLVMWGGLLRVGVLLAVAAWLWLGGWAGVEVVCVLGLEMGEGLVLVWSERGRAVYLGAGGFQGEGLRVRLLWRWWCEAWL